MQVFANSQCCIMNSCSAIDDVSDQNEVISMTDSYIAARVTAADERWCHA